MPTFLTPGAFVEEVPGGARQIAAVGTSAAAFLGVAPGKRAPVRRPVPVTSYAAFARRFARNATASTPLAAAVAGFFKNGGTRLVIVNLGRRARRVRPADVALLADIDGILTIAAPGFADAASHEALIGACEPRGDRFAVLDGPATVAASGDLAIPVAAGGVRPRASARGVAAFYAPWITVADRVTGKRVAAPPSGHVCGLYARVDATVGVHKAPAGLPLAGVRGVTRAITEAEQAVLNPAGVNAIRRFPDGIKVWGARTLAEPPGPWQYVPVRRLMTMVGQSIARGTRWAVFEPNDEPLWGALRDAIGAFLHDLWRTGTFAGTKPDEAFFVRCGQDTMTQADIDAGHVIALVGVAPMRPAEFVVVRIVQTAGGGTVDED